MNTTMRIFMLICAVLLTTASLKAETLAGSCRNNAADLCSNYLGGYSPDTAALSCRRWDVSVYSPDRCSLVNLLARCTITRNGQTVETLHYTVTGRWTTELVRSRCETMKGIFAGN